MKHTCIAYVVKSKTGPKEKQIIHSNQDVQVCRKYVDGRGMETPLYIICLPFEMFFRTWLSYFLLYFYFSYIWTFMCLTIFQLWIHFKSPYMGKYIRAI